MPNDTTLACRCGYEGGLDEYRQGQGDYSDVIYCPQCHHPHEMQFTTPNVELIEFKAKMRSVIAKLRLEIEEYKESREVLSDMFLDLYGGMKMIRDRAKEDASDYVKPDATVRGWARTAASRARKLNDVKEFAGRFVDQCNELAKQHKKERTDAKPSAESL